MPENNLITDMDAKRELARRELASRSLEHFVKYTKPDYEMKARLGDRYIHKEIIDALEAVEQGKLKRLMIFVRPRLGKQLSDSTPIITPDGFKNHGDLKVGDSVFGLDGLPKKILGVSEKTQSEYRIHFSNNESIDCHGNHEWVLQDWRFNPGINQNNIHVYETHELFSGKVDLIQFRIAEVLGLGDRGITISKIEKLDNLEYGNCIEVEGGVYLAGKQMIPTHNSELASIRFPLYYLGKNPKRKVVISSYSSELANDFGRKARGEFSGPAFQNTFPGMQLSDSKREGGNWEIDYQDKKTGVYIAGGGLYTVGTGGSLTGKGFDCMVAGTLVMTPNGQIPIEQIVEGDLVCTIGENNKRNTNKVIATRKIESSELLKISYKEKGETKSITCTQNHGIFIEGEGFMLASIARKGDMLKILSSQSDKGMSVEILDIEKISWKHDVYDIQVENDENFIANNILVHNCGIIDDPVKDRMEAESETTQRRIYEWYTSTFFTRRQDQNSAIILIMTRWTVRDLAGMLLEESKTGGDKWHVVSIPAIDENGIEMVWEGKWDKGYMLEEKNNVSAKDWAALYMQDPVASSSNIFRLDDYRYFLMSDFERADGLLKKEDLKCGIFVDPAFSSSNKSDSASVVCMGKHKISGNYYLLDIYSDTSVPTKTFNAILAMYDRTFQEGYTVDFVSIEDVSINRDQTKFIKDFRDFLKERNRYLIINQYRPEGKKMDRIKLILEPKFSMHSMFFRKDFPDKQVMNQLERQLLEYPFAKHDDIIDCLAQSVYVLDGRVKTDRDRRRDKSQLTYHNKITGQIESIIKGDNQTVNDFKKKMFGF